MCPYIGSRSIISIFKGQKNSKEASIFMKYLLNVIDYMYTLSIYVSSYMYNSGNCNDNSILVFTQRLFIFPVPPLYIVVCRDWRFLPLSRGKMMKHFTNVNFYWRCGFWQRQGLHSSDCTVKLWYFSRYALEFLLGQAVQVEQKQTTLNFTSILDLGFYPGGYKEMSSTFADQERPRISSQNARGGGDCRVSANECSCAHHVTWSPNKLWRSTSIFNLCFYPMPEPRVVPYSFTSCEVF